MNERVKTSNAHAHGPSGEEKSARSKSEGTEDEERNRSGRRGAREK